VSNLLVAVAGALLATNQPAALSNALNQQTGIVSPAAVTNSPAELELDKLMEADDVAQAEVDAWIKEHHSFAEKGAAVSNQELNARILKRFEPVRKSYEDYLKRYTNSASGHVAYASFLGDIGEEEQAMNQLETARGLDPKDPAIWNNLANIYGHGGPVTKAFDYYARAIELDATEPVYYHNFGTTVFLFRKDAMEHYGINEQQVFDKALELYDKAMKLTPADFQLATDVARTYYGIRPSRTEAALMSWTNAFKVAADEEERQGVHVHFARVKMHAGRFNEAAAHLNAVTNTSHVELKARLVRALKELELAAVEASTNTAAVSATNTPAPVPATQPGTKP
jgi:tetratricopeptide (TPR) repeat protein